MTDTIDAIVVHAKVLVEQITRDDCGQMVGQMWMGGSGGLLSRETIRVADALRLALDAHRQATAVRVAEFATPDTEAVK